MLREIEQSMDRTERKIGRLVVAGALALSSSLSIAAEENQPIQPQAHSESSSAVAVLPEGEALFKQSKKIFQKH